MTALLCAIASFGIGWGARGLMHNASQAALERVADNVEKMTAAIMRTNGLAYELIRDAAPVSSDSHHGGSR